MQLCLYTPSALWCFKYLRTSATVLISSYTLPRKYRRRVANIRSSREKFIRLWQNPKVYYPG